MLPSQLIKCNLESTRQFGLSLTGHFDVYTKLLHLTDVRSNKAVKMDVDLKSLNDMSVRIMYQVDYLMRDRDLLRLRLKMAYQRNDELEVLLVIRELNSINRKLLKLTR